MWVGSDQLHPILYSASEWCNMTAAKDRQEYKVAFLEMMGLAPSEADERLKKLVNSSYQSIRVVGRGTVRIDPEEVRNTEEFKRASQRAKAIVNS